MTAIRLALGTAAAIVLITALIIAQRLGELAGSGILERLVP